MSTRREFRKVGVIKLILIFFMPWPAKAEIPLAAKKKESTVVAVASCTQSLIEPNLKRFMETARAKGKPFRDEGEAKRAIAQIGKSDFVQRELKPAAVSTCQCILAQQIVQVRAATSEAQIEQIFRQSGPPTQARMQSCIEKHLAPVAKRKPAGS